MDVPPVVSYLWLFCKAGKLDFRVQSNFCLKHNCFPNVDCEELVFFCLHYWTRMQISVLSVCHEKTIYCAERK